MRFPLAKLGFAILILLAGTTVPLGAGAEAPSASKQTIIRELLEITDTSDLGIQFVQMMQQQLVYLYPTAPEKMWRDWVSELDPSEVTERVVEVYDENFTLEELSGLLAFYKTPAGRATLEKMPIVMQGAMNAGQQWAQGEAAKMQTRLEKEGFKPVQPGQP